MKTRTRISLLYTYFIFIVLLSFLVISFNRHNEINRKISKIKQLVFFSFSFPRREPLNIRKLITFVFKHLSIIPPNKEIPTNIKFDLKKVDNSTGLCDSDGEKRAFSNRFQQLVDNESHRGCRTP